MNTELTDSPPTTSTPILPTRPFFWSVRRELWENRSIYIAPLIASGVVLFGFGITAFRLPRLRLNALALESARQRAAIEMPYDIAAMMIMFTVVHRGHLLLSRCAPWRTSGSQHPVLEVAAGL